MPQLNPLEEHLTPRELAERWKLDVSTIRKLFVDEPGVLKIGRASGRGMKRGQYLTLRIPQSVIDRVYRERCK